MSEAGGDLGEGFTRVEYVSSVLRPGDTLVIGFRAGVTAEEADRMKAVLEERLPRVRITIVDGVEQMLVYTPDEVRAVQT